MFISCTKHLFERYEISYTKTIVQQYSKEAQIESLHFPKVKLIGMFHKSLRLVSGTRLSSSVLKKVSSQDEVHDSSLLWHACNKSHNKPSMQKKLYKNLQFLQLLKITFMWTKRYEYVYAYIKKEFKNIFERKLCNCFGQLLFIY